MHVLLTGAFGNVGSATLRELLAAGHSVRAFDLESPRARRLAGSLGAGLETVWGDLTDPLQVGRAVNGCQAVIHDAALIPPSSERDADLTRRVNVEGTRHVVGACQRQTNPPRLVFASSVSVHGPSQGREPPVHADDPLVGSDHYSRSKIEAESLVRASSLDWVVLRLGAAAAEVPAWNPDLDMAELFRHDPETRVEFVHPADVGLAQTRATDSPGASRRVWMIGGGASCQTTLGELNDAYFEAAGLGRLPRGAFGREPYYTDWMDTGESQALLRYQRVDFAEFRRRLRERLRWWRPGLTLARPLLRWWLLRGASGAGSS